MNQQDIRWEQRFSNFRKAFALLEKAVAVKELSELEREGLIQRFEYTFELAWNTLKDLLEFKGNSNILGSKDAIRLAFKLGIISDGDAWMRMVTSRTLTSHTYNEETAEDISVAVKEEYFFLFQKLVLRLEKERSGKQGTIL